MGAVIFRARADLRGRLRSAFLLILAIGIAGGVTLTAIAGARRTESAVSRFVASVRPEQGIVSADRTLLTPIAHLPEVVASARVARFAMASIDDANRVIPDFGLGTLAVDNFDMSHPMLLSGRLPQADRVDEVAVNASAVTNRHLHVGSKLRFRGFAPRQIEAVLEGRPTAPAGPVVEVHVVGAVRFPADLSTAQAAPGVTYAVDDTAVFTPAFLRAYDNRIAIAGGIFLAFRLRADPGAVSTFQAEVARLSAGKGFVGLGSDDTSAAIQAQHATNVEALALLLFGLLAGVVTLTLIAQAFARQVHVDAAEHPTLRAMGMTRRQLVAEAAMRTALISIVGASVALGVAIVASPRMPIGLARQAEIHRGYSVDILVLFAGFGVITAILTGWTSLVTWRATRAGAATTSGPTRVRRSSRIATALGQAGSPPSATVGVSMAFESSGGTRAISARVALASAAVAVTVVAAALTFGANLSRLAEHPRLQGWNWDFAVGNPHSGDVTRTAVPLLERNPTISAFSAIANAEGLPGQIEGRDTSVFGIDALKGPALVPYIAGRPPQGADEIAFGAKTMRREHFEIGQRVKVSTGGRTRSLLITGRVLLTPSIVNDSVPLGDAAVVSNAVLQALHAGAPVNVFLVRFAPGVDRAAALRRLQADFPGTVLGPVRPPDIENLRRVDHLPGLLAALFALIALLTVGNTLVTSVRRRRRDLAVLRTIGFVRRQVSAVVVWQATMVAVVAIVIGVPLGAAAGRATWTLVTRGFGLPPDAVIPGVALALVALVALVAANVIAIIPGLMATRTQPATTLHTQ